MKMNGVKKETSDPIGSELSNEQFRRIIREKDIKIQQMEQENKRLKSNLSEKTSEFQLRISELVQELERHAELVDQLQNQLAEYEQTKVAFHELQAKVAHTDSGFTSPESQINSSDTSEELLIRPKSPRNTDEICAALSSFVEQNNPFMHKSKGATNKDAELSELRDSLQPVIDCINRLYGQPSESSLLDEATTELEKSIKTVQLSSKSTTEDLAKVNPTDLLTFLLDTGSASKETTVREFVQKARTINVPTTKSSTETSKPELSVEEAQIVDNLQNRLAQNIHKLGSRALNTAEIAKQAKRLMLAYNIGQRLFAKYVMNQVVKSQGSLSELLSKPRQWHKLTDKGREAFRRIFAWLSDDKAIELLCSLSPRRISMPCDKVEHPTVESMMENYNPSTGPLSISVSNHSTVEDVKPQPKLTNLLTPVKPVSKSFQELTPLSQQSLHSTRSSSRWRHDDIPKEKIIDIFEAEKAKLREQESNLERAMINRSISPASSSKSSSTNVRKRQIEDSRSKSPVGSPISTFGGETSPCPVIGKFRVEPAPILQEQFEKYSYLDTEEVVKQVKEYLSRHSVSQRQFGENVLGLSQGSVSDLLARPKGWNMLTHKGREPFIRMKLFLDECKRFQKEKPLNEDVRANLESSRSPSISSHFDVEKHERALEASNIKKNFPVQIKVEPESEISIEFESINGKDDDDVSDFSNDIDTIDIARRTIEILQKHNIGEKTFGEQILKMSANGVTDVLMRPKAWGLLSWKGREPYVKMLNFLQDSIAIERLKEVDQRKNRLTKPMDTVTPTFKIREDPVKEHVSVRKSSPDYEPETQSLKRKSTNPLMDLDVPKKCPRTIITDKQKEALLYVFLHDPRPSQKTIEQLSIKLDLSTKTVSNWFHNYRTRQKAKDLKSGKEDLEKPAILGQMTIGDSPSGDDWLKGLTDLLKMNDNESTSFVDTAPTMVPTTASDILKSLTQQISGNDSDMDEPTPVKHSEGSSLEKVISRMHKLASAKQ
uniref:Homeobox protein cut-like n=1 Tax=Acrobeloides nanus TaxID=290746 RepID=A0A914DF19_9BILA